MWDFSGDRRFFLSVFFFFLGLGVLSGLVQAIGKRVFVGRCGRNRLVLGLPGGCLKAVRTLLWSKWCFEVGGGR
jgi:hypothetical protein